MKFWIAPLLLVSLVTHAEPPPKPPDWSSGAYLFQPKGCEFSVTFPAKPQLGNYQYAGEGNSCTTYYGVLPTLDGLSALKAECSACTLQKDGRVSEADVLDSLREHAEISGVEDAVFSFKESKMGSVGMYRGVMKNIGNTFVTFWIYGRQSGMMLVGSAPYKKYNEIKFDEFVESLRRIDY